MTDEEYQQIMGYMIGGIDFFSPEKKGELTSPEDTLKWVAQTQLAPTPLQVSLPSVLSNISMSISFKSP